MMICTGSLADLKALPYVEGTLPASEVEQFEEHFFDCPACLVRLQAIQAVGRELARNPVASRREPEPRIRLGWPTWLWTAGAIAAVLLVCVFTYESLEARLAKPTVAQGPPKSIPQMQTAAQPAQPTATPVRISQLADMTLPVYSLPNLRGESLDAHFEAGMKEYAAGNCRGAIKALAMVPGESSEGRVAEFYSGACQRRMGNLASASQLLRKVADAGDSPQQEAALYSLAQIALTDNDPVTAHRYLLRTISLRGDLEQRARGQERRLTELIAQDKEAKGKNPEAK
jgi:hypothetical protein